MGTLLLFLMSILLHQNGAIVAISADADGRQSSCRFLSEFCQAKQMIARALNILTPTKTCQRIFCNEAFWQSCSNVDSLPRCSFCRLRNLVSIL